MHALDRSAHRPAPTLPTWLLVVLAHLALLAWMTARAPARWRQDTPAPRRLEDRVAQALGGGATWAEERIDDDTVRLRNGHRCVLLRRPRAAAVDPMGMAGRATPWQAPTERPC